jgi:hypothetical protein
MITGSGKPASPMVSGAPIDLFINPVQVGLAEDLTPPGVCHSTKNDDQTNQGNGDLDETTHDSLSKWYGRLMALGFVGINGPWARQQA